MNGFDNILLEPEQANLLAQLVEASRNVPREERSKFLVGPSIGGTFLIHPGLPDRLEVFYGDVEALARAHVGK